MDVSRFEQNCKSQEGSAGRPCWPARLLVSVWVYSYSIGIASARAIEQLMSQYPGLRWLSATDGELSHAGRFPGGPPGGAGRPLH
jgi:hypothetical protein